MNTPFEELEYLADYLPDEGETVLMTRREGELVCEAVQRDQQPHGVTNAELYGRLVQANERLDSLVTLPLWCGTVFLFWACVSVHMLAGLSWSGWYFDVGLAIAVVAGCLAWIHSRQDRFFQKEIRPVLSWQLRRRSTDRFTLIGEVRQHPEFRVLLGQMCRWID